MLGIVVVLILLQVVIRQMRRQIARIISVLAVAEPGEAG